MYKEYKINRPPLPDGLGPQISLVKKLVTALGIKVIEKEGYEADDVIATLCKKARKSGLAVVIASSDKDLCQLIEGDAVSVYNYNKDKLIDKDSFFRENGFDASFMSDYLALAGDSTMTRFFFIVPNQLLPDILALLPEPRHNSSSPPALPAP